MFILDNQARETDIDDDLIPILNEMIHKILDFEKYF